MPVAQLDRVFGYEPKGRGFESLQARIFTINIFSLIKFLSGCKLSCIEVSVLRRADGAIILGNWLV